MEFINLKHLHGGDEEVPGLERVALDECEEVSLRRRAFPIGWSPHPQLVIAKTGTPVYSHIHQQKELG